MCAQAEEQVYEEVAERRWGLQRASGGSGLPGCALCSICPPAAGCDAGSLNGSSCSHQVTHLWHHSRHRGSLEFWAEMFENFVLCLQVFIHPAWTQRQSQVIPWDRQSNRHADVWRGWHSTDINICTIIHCWLLKKNPKSFTASVKDTFRLVLHVQELNS